MNRRNLTTRLAPPIGLVALLGMGTVTSLQFELLFGGGLVCLGSIGMAFVEQRRVRDRLDQLCRHLDSVARGELDLEIPPGDQDEFEALSTALAATAESRRGDIESLHRSRSLLELAPVSVIYCNRDDVVSYANAHCRQLLSDVAETTGISPSRIDDGGSVAFLFGDDEALRSIVHDEKSLPFRGVRTVGSEVFDVSIEAVRDLAGARIGSLISLDRITEAEKNALSLREAVESGRESETRMVEAAQRDRARADRDHEVATELRLKADRISEVMVAAASGDLSARTDLRGDAPMDQIATDLDHFLDDLAGRILQIREISTYLTQAGNQLDQVGRNLVAGARRTSDEVSAVAQAWAQTSEEVGGIDVSVKGLAESFESISDHASTAVKVSGSGVVAAKTARSAIEELDQSTKQIESILVFIDRIADQSKLLSLNASIEAARAGETGRGFKIVAQEVKKLANQTEDATRRIAETVAQILERGDRSVASIHAIGSVIDEINGSQGMIAETVLAQQAAVQGVRHLTDETRQRSHVIETSIEQLSLVAEATEADAAGTDREARRLLDLAKQLSDLTERFSC